MEQETLWNKYESHLLNEAVTQNRIGKLKSMFILVTRNITNPLDKVTREELERFLDDINKDKIKRILDKKPLSGSTKSDVKKFLKQFYKWLLGKNEYYPPEVAWIKTKIRKDERPQPKAIITLEQVKKLANAFRDSRKRILTLLLFDSGFRIDEALSIQRRNITWDKYSENKKCWWVECTRSKTICRKVPVPIFTEDINNFVNSSAYETLKPEESVFPFSYELYLRELTYNSKKTLHVKLSPHCLRHSSATHYAGYFEKDMMALCQRYGWSLSSDEAKIYIRMSGAYLKEAPKQIYNNEIVELKQQLKETQERFDKLEALIKPYIAENTKKRKQEAGKQ